jgi:hypothetical protein
VPSIGWAGGTAAKGKADVIRSAGPLRTRGEAGCFALRAARSVRTVTLDRRRFGLALSGAVVDLVAGGGRAAAADQALDIQVLQTAASVENVMVSAYETMLSLPLFSGPAANPALKTLLSTARDQHVDHAKACNEIVGKLGGRAQTGANPALAQAVSQQRSRLSDLGAAIDLALQLETAAAQTYQSDVAALGDLNARRLAASIMGVEAQHVGVLLVARFLVGARTPELVSLDSGTAAKLPPEAGPAGFPDPFAKADEARPPTEGAVK